MRNAFRKYMQKMTGKYLQLETARQSIKDVELLIEELHSMSGHFGNPFNKLGSAIYGVVQERT